MLRVSLVLYIKRISGKNSRYGVENRYKDHNGGWLYEFSTLCH